MRPTVPEFTVGKLATMNMDKMVNFLVIILAIIMWYFIEIFGIQLSFDMCCAVKGIT